MHEQRIVNTTTDYAPWVERLTEELKRGGAIRTPAVEAAFRRVPRHRFLERIYQRGSGDPGALLEPAAPWSELAIDPERPTPEQLERIYANAALPTRLAGGSATSSTSEPGLMAFMLEALQIEPGMQVLEIGAGTGYNAALLSELTGENGCVKSIDLQPDVAEQAQRLLDRWRPGRVTVLTRDGFEGAAELAPFDRIVATVGCPDLSPRWLEQLRPDGFLLLPLTHGGFCPLTRVWREGTRVRGRIAGFSGFMLMQGELATDRAAHFGRFRTPEQMKLFAEARALPPLPGIATLPDERNRAGSSAARGFWYFLALRDGRLFNSAASYGYGLHDEVLGDLLLDLQGNRVLLAGDEALYEQLLTLHADWQAAGAPGLDAYRLEFTPRGEQAARPGSWRIMRQLFDQWITVA